jgi:hypothetical protein
MGKGEGETSKERDSGHQEQTELALRTRNTGKRRIEGQGDPWFLSPENPSIHCEIQQVRGDGQEREDKQ